MRKWHLESPLFSALAEEERLSISAEMETRVFHTGQKITIEGAPSDAMYVVDSGWVTIFSEQGGRKVILANLGPGSILGEVDLLQDRPYSTTAEAASEVKVWSLRKSALKEVITREPSIGVKLSLASGSKVPQVTEYLAEQRLPGIPFFAELSSDALTGLAQRLQSETCRQGDTICWLGAPGDTMYIIESGEVEVVLPPESDQVPMPLKEGELLGEMALLANKPYAATYRASSEVCLWSMSRSDFDELVTQFPSVRRSLSRALSEHLGPEDRAMAEQRLESISLFAELPPEVLASVGQRLVLQHYPQGELIFSQGDPGDALFIIEMGEIKLASEGPAGETTVAWLESGDSFGEMALLTGKTRSVKAQAMTDTNLWVLYKNDYDDLMVEHPSISLSLGKVLSERLTVGFQEARPRATPTRMREIPMLDDLSGDELADLTRRLHPLQRQAGERIIAEGDIADAMYFIESGQVRLRTRTPEGRTLVAELEAGDIVGEAALLTGKPRASEAQAVTDLQLWSLEKADFDELTLKYPRFLLAISRVLSERLEAGAVREAAIQKPGEVARPARAVRVEKKRARPRTAAGPANALRGSLNWLVSRSPGFKLRMAVVGFLLLWLLGITLPASVISSMPLQANDLMALFQTPVPTETPSVQAAPAESQPTPAPTDTPAATETPVPASSEESGMENAVTLAVLPTDTPTPEPPTATPVPLSPTPRPPTATPTKAEAAVMSAARPPTVKVFDRNGIQRDLAWAQQTYGGWIEYAQPAAGACFRIVELDEISGPSSVEVLVLDEDGNPASNMMVRFGWPGDTTEQPTNGEGKVGFGMGHDSYVLDPNIGGAHTLQVVCEHPSDVARNWGMLAGTPHDHLNIVFQLVRTPK
jgi:CRP-like cAMP-binding protein